ncbi:MAG: phage/plasmid primase, P4 family [Oscillospiraceae bacterium]|nr:phage/plasmid primase, P4 family [Oscillospiraceae bacterium]
MDILKDKEEVSCPSDNDLGQDNVMGYDKVPTPDSLDPKKIGSQADRYLRDTTSTNDSNSSPSSFVPNDFTDAGNAKLFAEIYRNELIYVDGLGWLHWNGKIWDRDNHVAMRCATEMSYNMLNIARENYTNARQALELAKSNNSISISVQNIMEAKAKKANLFLRHATTTRNGAHIKNMVELAKPEFVVTAAQLDANPFDLNTPAGIIDVRTGEMREHDRTAYCTKITAVSLSDEGIQEWHRFLAKITNNNLALQNYLQRGMGMSLYGKVFEELFFFAYGSGRNGKSTFIEAITGCLGDYAGAIDVKTITTERQNRGASLATLRGKRFVATGELENFQYLSSATIKHIASTGPMVIEEKYRQPETVQPSHTLIVQTNYLPRVISTDNGTWRRVRVIPFPAEIPVSESIPAYSEQLIANCGGAILSWLLIGAIAFKVDNYKLHEPDEVLEAMDAYRKQENWIANFVDDCCVLDPNARVEARKLYDAYCEWAQDTGEFKHREVEFSQAMTALKFQQVKPHNKKTWLGLRLAA